PDSWRAGLGVDPQSDPRASGGFAARTVAETVPGVELGSTQWRRVRHGVPRFDAGAGPRRAYHITTAERPTAQSADRAGKTSLSRNRYFSDCMPPEGFGSAGIPFGAAYCG